MSNLTKTLKKELWQSLFSLRNRVADANIIRMISSNALPEQVTPSTKSEVSEKTKREVNTSIPSKARFVYPEFLPDPKMEWRNSIREKLERLDMMKRRKHIDIPEFYVGSVMAVTSSTVHAQNKTSRFVGICIQRTGCGLRAQFVLRNIVDHLGTEIVFRIYDPTIQKIDVLRLEKRLDNELFYLRDALPEYSTFPLDMEAEILPEGTPVPVNEIKVKMKPKPWTVKWERKFFLGIEEMKLNLTSIRKRTLNAKPWEKYDLMKEYRGTIPEEEQKEIFGEIYSDLHELELTRKKLKRKKMFVKPVKTS